MLPHTLGPHSWNPSAAEPTVSSPVSCQLPQRWSWPFLVFAIFRKGPRCSCWPSSWPRQSHPAQMNIEALVTAAVQGWLPPWVLSHTSVDSPAWEDSPSLHHHLCVFNTGLHDQCQLRKLPSSLLHCCRLCKTQGSCSLSLTGGFLLQLHTGQDVCCSAV
jgi:hypothetical protein